MNLKTTLALLVLLGGAALVYLGQGQLPSWVSRQPAPPAVGSSATTFAGFAPADIQKISIARGKDTFLLDRAKDDTWRLAGNWPTKPAEVKRLLDALGNLRSRFVPEEEGDFKPSVTLTVTTKSATSTLAFGEKASDDSTRFDRPTYVKVGEEKVVHRLAPGLVALLDHPADYYQQRRLFPSKRELKEETGTARVERLLGQELVAEDKGQQVYAIRHVNDAWELSYPLRDALDPRSRDQLLEAVADLWAEKFVEKPPEKFTVEKRLILTRGDGSKLTLEIGPTVPGGMEDKPRSFARLVGNDRVFEISASKFNDIFPRLESLRDGQLARFTAGDARELILTTSKGKIVLRNQAARKGIGDGPPPPSDWRIVAPITAKADSATVDKLLSSLSNLPALDRDAGMKVRLGAAIASINGGLASPWFASDRFKDLLGTEAPTATIAVNVEEGPVESPRKKAFTIALGRHDPASKKLYARSGDWPRVNEIEDSVGEQVIGKGPLDLRGKKVLELAVSDVEKGKGITIQTRALPPGLALLGMSPLSAAVTLAAGGDRITVVEIARHSDGHFIRKPVVTPADASKFAELAGKLAGLEALTWIDEIGKDHNPNYELLYGLDRPTVEATFAGRVLQVGRPRSDGPGWYARLHGTAEVFTVANELVDLLRRDSLAYRPAQLWTVAGDEITQFTIERQGQPHYQIVRKGMGWEVTGPFTVAAPPEVVAGLVKMLSAPRAEEHRAHKAADLKPFGLATPSVVVTVRTKSGKEHTLALGGDADPGRFATMGKDGGVFIVGDALAMAADRNALDFLDRALLRLDAAALTSFVRQRGADVLELAKKDDVWEIVKPTMQPGDDRKVRELLDLLSGLRAERLVAYAPKDLKPFGLHAPFATITIGKDVLLLGAEVPGTGERYAQVKGAPAVGVLSAVTLQRLLAGPLMYRDHLLARVPDAEVMKLEAGERKVTFGKPEGSWKLTAPLSAEADHDALETFLNSLSRLRADELINEKPSAADLKKFGLDKPLARWQLTSDGKTVLDLAIGGREPSGPRHYAKLASSDLVFLLDPKVSSQVLTEYRPRSVFKDIDPAQIEAVRFGHREGAFELRKAGANWEVVGKPEVKVNAAAVTDALSALRELKLERYIRDADAPLKLYGLDPAELVLEVTTPDGTKVLHLGGIEGGSKRRYARLPRPKPADVFVLDEAASTKLFRKLADLTAK